MGFQMHFYIENFIRMLLVLAFCAALTMTAINIFARFNNAQTWTPSFSIAVPVPLY